MGKTKELIICIISVVALILAITTNVFADDSGPDDIWNAFNINNNTSNSEIQQIPGGTGRVNNTNNNINNNINNKINNKNNNTSNSMPNTGIGGNSSLIIIAVAGISAIYAYRKIKEYNV